MRDCCDGCHTRMGRSPASGLPLRSHRAARRGLARARQGQPRPRPRPASGNASTCVSAVDIPVASTYLPVCALSPRRPVTRRRFGTRDVVVGAGLVQPRDHQRQFGRRVAKRVTATRPLPEPVARRLRRREDLGQAHRRAARLGETRLSFCTGPPGPRAGSGRMTGVWRPSCLSGPAGASRRRRGVVVPWRGPGVVPGVVPVCGRRWHVG